MPDVVDTATRSRMMSGIRGKNTKPELSIRRGLHELGLRYRLHASDVAGKPDMTFPKYRAAVFVNGCFWHGHDCNLFRMPGTRPEFWAAKITANRARDRKVAAQLLHDRWRQLTIWECAIRGSGRREFAKVISEAANWIRSGEVAHVIRGTV